MDPDQRLAQLGIVLPDLAANPLGAYVPGRVAGGFLYVSGQLPSRDGKMLATGTVPSQVTVETARQCARQCAINGLAAAKASLGPKGLKRIKQVVRVGAFIASDAGFSEQPKVANACSELLQEVFGEAGRHARAAVGTNVLPMNVPVEIEFLFEIAE